MRANCPVLRMRGRLDFGSLIAGQKICLALVARVAVGLRKDARVKARSGVTVSCCAECAQLAPDLLREDAAG